MTRGFYTSNEMIDRILDGVALDAARERRAGRLRAMTAAALPQVIATRPQMTPAEWAERAVDAAAYALALIEEIDR